MKIVFNVYLFLLICVYSNNFAQSVERQVLGSAGELQFNSSSSMSYTVGETFTSTLTSANSLFELGFQQGHEDILSTEELAHHLAELQLFPNPTIDFFTVKLNGRKGNWQIIDEQGKLIQVGNCEGEFVKIDVRELPVGSYFWTYRGESTSESIKFIKQL